MRVEVAESYGDEPVSLYVGTARGGSFVPLVRGARLALGEDEWDVAEIVSLVLAPIPKPKPEPVAAPSRRWRAVYVDGTEEVVEVGGAGEVRASLQPLLPIAQADWGISFDRLARLERVDELEATM